MTGIQEQSSPRVVILKSAPGPARPFEPNYKRAAGSAPVSRVMPRPEIGALGPDPNRGAPFTSDANQGRRRSAGPVRAGLRIAAQGRDLGLLVV